MEVQPKKPMPSQIDKATATRAGIIGIFLIVVGLINDIIGIIFLWKSDTSFDGIFLRRAHGIWAGMLVSSIFFCSLLLLRSPALETHWEFQF